MTKNAFVSEDLAQKVATENETPYLRWVRAEGLDIISSFYVRDLHAVDLKPWARRGGRGIFLNHDASRSSNDCYVCEIPPGGHLTPQRQLYEEVIYVLEGRGSTAVWNEAGIRTSFEWNAGAMFAIPLNAWHQHFNGSGLHAVRYVAVTNAPVIINAFGDLDFVFNTARDFKDRFNGEPDYFANRGEHRGLVLDTNLVADAVNLPLADKERAGGGSHIRVSMAKGQMDSHISQLSVGTYTRAHMSGPGTHVIIMSGEGYGLMWPEGEAPQRYEWNEGSMSVPPNLWYTQHFNTGTTPARVLAFTAGGASPHNAQGMPKDWISKGLGGDQIDYADESLHIRQGFSETLAARGRHSRMDAVYEAEFAERPLSADPAP